MPLPMKLNISKTMCSSQVYMLKTQHSFDMPCTFVGHFKTNPTNNKYKKISIHMSDTFNNVLMCQHFQLL
uniref:Uncharacterized protein n=1 Tax=Rhizophora mucronata TaxID=61149 RepID=A0A2P2J0S7_RHIMU